MSIWSSFGGVFCTLVIRRRRRCIFVQSIGGILQPQRCPGLSALNQRLQDADASN